MEATYTPNANYNGSDSLASLRVTHQPASNNYTMALLSVVNDAPTGSVTVAGRAVQEALNAANTLADVDGLPAGSIFRYQCGV
jgi:hypothetical protein